MQYKGAAERNQKQLKSHGKNILTIHYSIVQHSNSDYSITKIILQNLRKTQKAIRVEEQLHYKEKCINIILPRVEGRQQGKEVVTHREGNG